MFGDVEKVYVHVYNCDVGGVTSVALLCDVTRVFSTEWRENVCAGRSVVSMLVQLFVISAVI